MSSLSLEPETTALAEHPWRIKLLYDGECPLCLREVNFLKKKDNNRGLVAFVDISDDNYQPREHGDIDYVTAMGRIHGILADGTMITDLEVFRQVYDILGMGWLYSGTRYPLIRSIADQIYRIWAKLRLKLTGRPSLDILVAERQARIGCSQNCGIQGQKSRNLDNIPNLSINLMDSQSVQPYHLPVSNQEDSFTPLPDREPILCPHCQRTVSNGIKCKGICVADSDY